MAEINTLKRHSEEMPPYVWDGSEDWERLGRLEEILCRFPPEAVAAAKDQADNLRLPDLRFRIDFKS
jgi:hypothetical protein